MPVVDAAGMCSDRYIVGRQVRWTVIDHIAVILDLDTGHYSFLDRVATTMWEALLGSSTVDEKIKSLGVALNAERSVVASDLSNFAQQCVRRRWLSNAPAGVGERSHRIAPMRGPTARWTLSFRAWWAMLRTVTNLRTRGFPSTYAEYGNLPRRRPRASAESNFVRYAIGAFLLAENFFLHKRGPDDCLPRSLALFRYLTLVGVQCDHCIGVQRTPFFSHAWVEIEGRKILEPPESGRTFQVVARM